MTHEELNGEYLRVKRLIDSFVIEEPKLFSRKTFTIGKLVIDERCDLMHVVVESPIAAQELTKKFNNAVNKQAKLKISPYLSDTELLVSYHP